ncbi:uncharacterized protein LOC114648718 isoform X3 [Erpetoichthys calabaricus]|nr:uncharacterized protein LOC114648718 isoform X3 [Erpetoichthys calabaricus]
MFCPYCGSQLGTGAAPAFCSTCGRSLAFLPSGDQSSAALGGPPTGRQHPQNSPTLTDFFRFKEIKNKERSVNFTTKRKSQKDAVSCVQINVGIIRECGGMLKKERGRTLPLRISSRSSKNELLHAAETKLCTFNNDLPPGPYVLLYADGSLVNKIPGSASNFILQDYKNEIGKQFNRITFFICPEAEYNKLENDSSDPEEVTIHPKHKIEEDFLNDTVLFVHSSPREKNENLTARSKDVMSLINPVSNEKQNMASTSSKEVSTSCTSVSTGAHCYRTYTEVYAPILVESDTSSSSEDEFAHNVDCFNDKIVSVEDILENLATQIKSEKVSRFNINRADIWDGALRGFKRSSFDPAHTILVKFSDNTGYMESGIDTGGPKREFLELLMQHVKNRTLFEGRETEKYLTCDSVAFDNDEYFIIGRMIAVSMVHGGPGPQFISKNLFNYILCEGIFSPDTKDVCDPEIQMMLQKIKSSSSVECLRSTVEVYATMLMIAGCLCHVIRELSDKDKIVEDYLKWYFFTRNAACIQSGKKPEHHPEESHSEMRRACKLHPERTQDTNLGLLTTSVPALPLPQHVTLKWFKEGLTTLNVLEAMKQNPSGFMKYFCFSEKKITSEIIENLFKAEFSQPGSNRRQEEVRTAAYWADYLLDIEGKTSFAEPSLEDILMFSTGVSSIPPIGFHPKPTVNFLHNESPYPIAQTCTNSLSIPIHKTYDKFKYHMNFGILNSPGFGQH